MRETCCIAMALVTLAGCSCRGEPTARIAELTAALGGESRDAQLAAIDELGRMGPAAKEAVPALSGLVVSPEWRVSQPAASALTKIDADAIVALLKPRLQSDNQATQSQAVKALEYVGPGAAPFVQELTSVVRTAEDGWARAAAANGLGQIGPAAANAVPALIEGLQHPTEHVRRYCARGLGGIGAKAAAAIPDLERAAAKEGDRRFAEWAREALERIRKAQQE